MIIRIELDDLELVRFDGGGSEMMNYEGLLFSGIAKTTKDGIVCGEEKFQNGYKEGIHTRYSPSGNLELEYF
jgi:antitoxin component YwqK of YwqJK toxin-antitoxin module